jgi:hypothetical protein
MWEKIQYCGKHILLMGFLSKTKSFEILASFWGNPSCVGDVVTCTVCTVALYYVIKTSHQLNSGKLHI